MRIPDHRRHHRPHAPTCGGRKRGSDAQEIGRSRGGLSTKINAVVDALGNPLRFILTGGHVHDSKQAQALIEGFDFDKLLADKGYDSDRFRMAIDAAEAEAVIPSIASRSQAIPYDKHVYKERNLVERFFCKLKQFRAISTRYDKLANTFLAAVAMVCVLFWLN